MARPTRSRIIPADSHSTGTVEKWPVLKQRATKDNIVPFGNRAARAARAADSGSTDSTDTKQNVSNTGNNDAASGEVPQEDFANTGYTEEMRIALAHIAEQQKQLAILLSALENPVRELNDSVARELLLLSQDIARAVLQKEIEQDPALLSEFVKTAISQLPAAIGPPVVSAHPEDLRILKELGAPALSKVSIEWVEDPRAERGSFEVRRDDSVIHGGIDAMLQRALSQSDSPVDE